MIKILAVLGISFITIPIAVFMNSKVLAIFIGLGTGIISVLFGSLANKIITNKN